MAPQDLRFICKETRLGLEPPSASSIVIIRVSSSATHSRSNSRRLNGIESSVLEEEKAYRLKNLSTASSIYHRKHHSSPRSFLWRILEEGTVLSIRVVDVCRQEKEPDAQLILNLQFQSAIRPFCVSFADPKEHDSLTVFALDHTNTLYTVTLRPDIFRKRSVAENGLGEACKAYLSSAFSFKHPHRLVAVSSDQLVVTLHDGGLLKFDRNKSHDATSSNIWKETFYNALNWAQGLRRMLPFQGGPTVRYDKVNMELSAATSTAIKPIGDGSDSLLFSVCLDHHMRIWNVNSGQILYSGDLLKATRKPEEIGKWTIDPSQSNLIRLLEVSDSKSLVVTYSPVGAGEFKLWRVDMREDNTVFVHDYFPDHKLIPFAPSSSDVWTLADFGINHASDGRGELWILWKNNITYRVQRTEFCTRIDAVQPPWEKGLDGVFINNQVPTAQTSGPCEPTDPAEKWLQLIFFPGRFSKSTLETALAMYERGLGSSSESSLKGGKGLAESICSVLGSTAVLERSPDGGMDYEQFRSTSEIQWRRFYRLLVELDKQRGEALSLVLDSATGFTSVVCSDCIAVVRKCSDLDRICHNLTSPLLSKDQSIVGLISAGLNFVEAFTDGMWQLSRAALQAELFEDSSRTDEERIQRFSDKAGFWRQISDDECAQVVETLGDKFRIVTAALYQDFFDAIKTTEDAMSREPRHPFTEFGRSLVVKAVQETAELQWQILFSQLILLVHMEFEFDDESDALHSRFDIGSVYRQFLDALRRLEHIKWLGKTEINIPSPKSDRSSSIDASPTATKRPLDDARSITAFEAIVGHLLGLVDMDNQSLLSSLTDVVVDLCAPDSDTELLPSIHQCWLLKQDRPDLALELNPFCDQDPFSTYVQGRVFLALKDYDTAAFNFRKAAIGLSISMRHVDRHSARLLDETEWKLFNSGLPNYYSHIVALYEKQKAFSYVVEFARLALQFTSSLGGSGPTLRMEMLSRLFTAATAISQFEIAHSALVLMKDEALQKSCLKKLVEKMCQSGRNAELVAFPFAGLQTKVDEILHEKCQATKDVLDGIHYHKILYAWRTNRNNHRGAAEVLLDRLKKLQQAGEGDKLAGDDAMDTTVTRQYLLLINALSCVSPKEQWILEELPKGAAQRRSERSFARLKDLGEQDEADGATPAEDPAKPPAGANVLAKLEPAATARLAVDLGPRRLMTLGNIRKQYQEELDRIAAIQNNQFEFAAGDDDDAMDIA